MAKEISGIDLSNGNLVIKYGDDYVHCYEGWLGCLSQILYDIVTYYAEDGDTSDWDGNEIELLDEFDNCKPKDLLDSDELIYLLVRRHY